MLPHIGSIVDELCFIRSMHTDAVNHAPAQIMMNTGSQQFGRPSFGSWTLYGLGSEIADLPGYVVLTSAKGTSGGASNYGCGFLPTAYGGVPFRSTRRSGAVSVEPAAASIAEAQRDSLDALQPSQSTGAAATSAIPKSPPASRAYEMAYRLQTSAPELMDLSQRAAAAILDLYGIKDRERSQLRPQLPAGPPAGRARRALRAALPRSLGPARQPDAGHQEELRRHRPAPAPPSSRTSSSAACWTTRSSSGAANSAARRWCKAATTAATITTAASAMWLAGGGIKKGHVHGETDELGFNVVQAIPSTSTTCTPRCSPARLRPRPLTYRFQGRDYRLTDVHGKVVTEILA